MKLHELLAIEKSQMSQVNVLIQDVLQKFSKDHMFKGWIKRLKMIKDSPDNTVIEAAGSESRDVVTTVSDTLEYMLKYWAANEDTQFRKNRANQSATADIVIGTTVISEVPIDELMGLEARLTKLREIFQAVPTLDATKYWVASQVKAGVLQSDPETTTKTEKIITPIVLYDATKEHPAQIKEVSKDEVVGSFTIINFSGAVTSLQKAKALERIDDLIGEIKKARMRANCQEVPGAKIGNVLATYLLEPFK